MNERNENTITNAETVIPSNGSKSNKYDVIIIGSGIGGLTCGAFLARSRKRVLVLEQHTKIGGYTHHFQRGKFIFESGVHSAPIAKDRTLHHLLSLLGVADQIYPVALPEMYHIDTPDSSFTMPASKDDVFKLIHDNFPHQIDAFNAFDRELDLFRNHIIRPLNNFEHSYYHEDRAFVSRYHNLSYYTFVKKYITDKSLQCALFSQWPYGGISSMHGAALFHGMLYLLHLDEGSYTLKGGFSTLADALFKAITSRGGHVLTKQKVTGLKTNGNEVNAVIANNGDEYYADTVVSNISPYLIHTQLIDKKGQNRRWHRRLQNLNPSVSSVIVYLGMKPGSLDGIKHSTYFWAESSNNELIYKNILANNKDRIDHLVFLKNISTPEYPTLTLMNFTQKSFSNNWKSDKLKLADTMLHKAETLFPGIKQDIVVMEVGSPATFEHYTGNTDGAIYGFENVKTIYGEAKMPIATHLNNLYQVGHWGRPGCGVWNVMINGYTASHQILEELNGKT